MDRAFQRIRSLMLRGTFYSVPPSKATEAMAKAEVDKMILSKFIIRGLFQSLISLQN